MARLKEELRLAQKESEENAKELERLHEEKKMVSKTLCIVGKYCSSLT